MRRIYTPDDAEFDLQLFAGSGAGLNRVSAVLLNCAALASQTYDTMLVNGPNGQTAGPRMVEAAYFSKWLFQLTTNSNVSSVTGWSAAFYGTIDEAAYYSTRAVNWMQVQPSAPWAAPGYTFPLGSWAFLESPAGGAGGSWPNPLLNVGVQLYVPIPLIGVRCIVTSGSTAPTADISVLGLAVP